MKTYIIYTIAIALLATIIVIDKIETNSFENIKNDKKIKKENVTIDTVIKKVDEVTKTYTKMKEEKKVLKEEKNKLDYIIKENKRKSDIEKINIKDSIIRIERAKATDEKQKIKIFYERQISLDTIR